MEPIRSVTTVPYIPPHISNITDHPDLGNIFFSKLNPFDLVRSSRVCRRWLVLANRMIPKLISSDILDDLLPFVQNSVISIREIIRFGRIAKFLAQCCEDDKNQSLDTFRPGTKSPYKPYARFGNYEFLIQEDDQIKVSLCKKTVFLLRDSHHTGICAIAVSKEYLFALTAKSYLLQWNYKTGELVQIHETALTKILNRDDGEFVMCGSLDERSNMRIERGWLFISHIRKAPNIFNTVFEYRPLSSLKNSFVLPDLNQEPIRLRVINGQLCYLHMDNFHYGDKTIRVGNNLCDYTIQNNRVYVCDDMGWIGAYDLISQKALNLGSTVEIHDDQTHRIEVSQNYILLYLSTARRISIYDAFNTKCVCSYKVDEGILLNLINFFKTHRLTPSTCNLI